MSPKGLLLDREETGRHIGKWHFIKVYREPCVRARCLILIGILIRATKGGFCLLDFNTLIAGPWSASGGRSSQIQETLVANLQNMWFLASHILGLESLHSNSDRGNTVCYRPLTLPSLVIAVGLSGCIICSSSYWSRI